jgi:hypothetical protein
MTPRMPEPARILILSKNEESVDPLAFLLNIAGYEVLALKDDVRAVEAAAAFHPTICLVTHDSTELADNLRSTLPTGELVFAELGTASRGHHLHLNGDENNFQIVERIEDYLHEIAVAV